MNESGKRLVRVLIVEDNLDDRDLLIRQLAKIKVEDQVKFITDGQEALDYIKAISTAPGEFDLIALFLDLKLPSVRGVDILSYIRNNSRIKDLPVIIMTSTNNPQELEECMRLNANYFIPKPITFDSFTKAVANIFHE